MQAGYDTSGPAEVPVITNTTPEKSLAFYRLQQRLNYLGFLGADVQSLELDGVPGTNLKHAVGVFNAAVCNANSITPTRVVNAQYINSRNARRWVEFRADYGIDINPNVGTTKAPDERWGQIGPMRCFRQQGFVASKLATWTNWKSLP